MRQCYLVTWFRFIIWQKKSRVFQTFFFFLSINCNNNDKENWDTQKKLLLNRSHSKEEEQKKMRNKAKKKFANRMQLWSSKKEQNNHHFNIIGYFTNDYDLYWCINELHSIGKDTYILVRTPKEKKTHQKFQTNLSTCPQFNKYETYCAYIYEYNYHIQQRQDPSTTCNRIVYLCCSRRKLIDSDDMSVTENYVPFKDGIPFKVKLLGNSHWALNRLFLSKFIGQTFKILCTKFYEKIKTKITPKIQQKSRITLGDVCCVAQINLSFIKK